MPKPPDMRCGICDQRLVPGRGRYVEIKPHFRRNIYAEAVAGSRRYYPNAWNNDYHHAYAMFDRHGAHPVAKWEEE